MKKEFEIKNILGNSQKRTYRREIWRQRFIGIFYLFLTIFIGISIYSACNGGVKIGSLEPIQDKIEVKAVENTIEEEKVTDHSIIWLIDKIHLMESSRGKNGGVGTLQKYCEDKGMWNEYGYGGMSQKICFKDKEEADETMIKWFEKQFKTKTESQTICYYRHGEIMSNCDYYQTIIN